MNLIMVPNTSISEQSSFTIRCYSVTWHQKLRARVIFSPVKIPHLSAQFPSNTLLPISYQRRHQLNRCRSAF